MPRSIITVLIFNPVLWILYRTLLSTPSHYGAHFSSHKCVHFLFKYFCIVQVRIFLKTHVINVKFFWLVGPLQFCSHISRQAKMFLLTGKLVKKIQLSGCHQEMCSHTHNFITLSALLLAAVIYFHLCSAQLGHYYHSLQSQFCTSGSSC